jgi:hypothetical protein
MAPADWLSITHFSAFVRPPGDALMAAFKGYFDESGKEDDPQFADSAIAVAGYVAQAGQWPEIEANWQAVLARPEFGVPYLHMKEFAHSKPGSPFESWKGDEPKRAAFIAALAEVIRKSGLFGAGAVIRLPDLWEFNRDFAGDIKAYPLGVCACLIELSQAYPDSDLETVWDKIDDHSKQIALARSYAKSDRFYPNCGKRIDITPLEANRSSKCIPALQIADFAAYELLKSHRVRNEWWLNERPFLPVEQWQKSQFYWTLRKFLKDGKSRSWPDERKSYLSIFSAEGAPRMEGTIWTYRVLVRSHLWRCGIWTDAA